MEANLSIIIICERPNLEYLIQILESSLFKHYPNAEYIVGIKLNSANNIKNYLNTKKNIKTITLNTPDYKLEHSYKELINHCSREYILLIPHQFFYFKTKIPVNAEKVVKNDFKSFVFLCGSNFDYVSSNMFLSTKTVFNTISFPLVNNFKEIIKSLLPKFSITMYYSKILVHDFLSSEKSEESTEMIKEISDTSQSVPEPPSIQHKIFQHSLVRNMVSKEKGVLIITIDPYPIEEQYCPRNYSNKARKTTAPGIRAWSMINYLHNNGVKVTVGCMQGSAFKPLPGYPIQVVDIAREDLNKYRTIITQTGHPQIDKLLLKYSKKLILDCWIPSVVEFPYAISNLSNNIRDYEVTWRNLSTDLYRRADHFLYSNEKSLGLVIGTAAAINPKISISDVYVNSNNRFLYVPYCAPVSDSFVYKQKTCSLFFSKYPSAKGKTTFGWFGGAYPWFDFSTVRKHLLRIARANQGTICCVFKSLKHPFYKNLGDTVNNDVKNVIVDKMWVTQKDKVDYLTDIDYFMIFGKPGFEQIFANRTRILDLCSNNCIVITNQNDVIGQVAEKYGLAYLVDEPNNDKEIDRLVTHLVSHKKEVMNKKNVNGFRKEFDYNRHYNKLLGIV